MIVRVNTEATDVTGSWVFIEHPPPEEIGNTNGLRG
jgi:hypothetical protein